MRPLLVAFRILGACGTPSGNASCGAASALAPDPADATHFGVHVGPLWLFTDYASRERAEIRAAGLLKTVVRADLSVTVEGKSCEGGSPLRFSFSGGVPSPIQGTEEELARTGDITAAIQPGGDVGYLIFSHAGAWLLTVRAGGAVAGSAVFVVDRGP